MLALRDVISLRKTGTEMNKWIGWVQCSKKKHYGKVGIGYSVCGTVEKVLLLQGVEPWLIISCIVPI